MKRLIAALLVTALLAACSSHTEVTTASSATPAPATTNTLAGTPMAAYGTDLNKAKNVQNVIDQSARKQDAAIEAATGSSSGGP
jgi:PBP1b-binding outer membrane lipoprotein LpoB